MNFFHLTSFLIGAFYVIMGFITLYSHMHIIYQVNAMSMYRCTISNPLICNYNAVIKIKIIAIIMERR